jgi:tRNA G18 (ribose-2'-O)-methylase SpoU
VTKQQAVGKLQNKHTKRFILKNIMYIRLDESTGTILRTASALEVKKIIISVDALSCQLRQYLFNTLGQVE